MAEKHPEKKYIFDWKGAVALIGGMVIGSSLFSLINVFSVFVFNEDLQYRDFYLLIVNATGFLGAIFAFDYFIVRPQTGRKLNFNFSPVNFETWLLIFPMMFGMMLIAEFITGQIPITGPFFGPFYDFFSGLMERMTKDEATLILLAVVMAPIFEEIVFRGIILKGLINKGMRPLYAILISSVIFGLVHANPWQFVGAVLLGCVLGLVYYKAKSLLLPMLLHAFNNLCSSLLIFYGNTESFADAFKVSELLILGVGVVLFSVFFFLFMKKYKVLYAENDD
ncbi:CPBP family intramembrane glutamic endopeptidase [Chryseobacterium sp.]|uniref:CPBP family intramembrane glutamic endopeptidase n=1 Tax=Chryseobacterium sp. TaxID=1871047 RepID=UPI0011CC9F20|nr:type II CAAX endopeptidase family protein [Chryseobacterium sp.]TXF77708.1 CPBP family intramembrane metalloprotease [Chryseobacterium sp.]